MAQSSYCWNLLLAFTVLLLTGCGGGGPSDVPELEQVTGIVTLDGKPLDAAIILFEPVASGASSTGATDAEGKYHLIYSAKANGAVSGEHKVRISKLQSDAGMETLHRRFNENTELKATVVKGQNQLNFDLASKPSKAVKK